MGGRSSSRPQCAPRHTVGVTLATIGSPETLDTTLHSLADPSSPLGGGAAAALALAGGAALLTMAGRAGGWEGAAGTVAQGRALERRALELRDRNVSAYGAARAALDRRAEERGRDGDFDIGDTLAETLDGLMRLAEAAGDVAALASESAEHCEPARRPDALTALLLAEAAARAAALLIEANLATLDGDPELERAREVVASVTESRRGLLGE